MKGIKQNIFIYRIAQFASWIVSTFIFRRKIIRNEIKNKQGPFVVIANHQAALDFVNLIGITKTPMTFVISNSFYNSLPIKSIISKIGVIPKQQFQTTVKDMKKMKSVIDSCNPLVIYPAGLMCEDGLSTPIPVATYKFLKWLGADVYVARTYGTYFSMPKWSKGLRVGKTELDVYKLFSKDELLSLDVPQIKEDVQNTILFDAYKEQEGRRFKYSKGDNIEGLQHVLYMCPHCKKEFTINIKNKNTLFCKNCGYEQCSDRFGFLHKTSQTGEEIRYVSDWSRLIYNDLKNRVINGDERELSSYATIRMIDYSKNKFVDVGEAQITLQKGRFIIKGVINGQEKEIIVPTVNFASLPFSPGKYFEIQCGENIYRCVLCDGRHVMKFINMVKIFYELHQNRIALLDNQK